MIGINLAQLPRQIMGTMKRHLLLIVLVILSTPTFAQEGEACSMKPQHKKVKKLYEKLYDRSITDQDRFKLLNEAIDIDEECAVCYYDFARLAYYRAQTNYTSFNKAREYFKKAIDICPNFNADVYLSLGMIAYYEERPDEAMEWFEQFVSYESEDKQRYGNGYQSKVEEVKKIMEPMVFKRDFFANKVDFDPVLVPNVNSRKDEHLPMISPDNEVLFYTRGAMEKDYGSAAQVEIYKEALIMAEREDIQLDFDAGDKMGMPFSDESFTNFGGVTISVDNRELILAGCKRIRVEVNGQQLPYTDCNLYSTQYEKKTSRTGDTYYEWSELKGVGTGINSSKSWESTPTLSGDGKTLYYAHMPEGQAQIDIYYSKRKDDGSWGPGRPLDAVNTNGDDKSPFMHADSKTLYYVSGPATNESQNPNNQYQNAKKSPGGFDIYFVKQNDDGSWTEPKLLAYPINTEYDEEGLIVSTDGHTAYFFSNRMNGEGGRDLFYFELYKEARPERVVLLKGEVMDENGQPDQDAVVEIQKRGEDEVTQVKVNDDGGYAAVVAVEEDEELIVKAKRRGAFMETKLVPANIAASTYVTGTEFQMETVEMGKTFTIQDILYATNSYELTDESKFVLDQFVEFLQDNPGLKIEIQGHTDNVGDAGKNLTLSNNRAKGVRDYLVSKGISASRLTSKGYGETQPKVPNDSAANKALNRRTDFKIIGV